MIIIKIKDKDYLLRCSWTLKVMKEYKKTYVETNSYRDCFVMASYMMLITTNKLQKEEFYTIDDKYLYKIMDQVLINTEMFALYYKENKYEDRFERFYFAQKSAIEKIFSKLSDTIKNVTKNINFNAIQNMQESIRNISKIRVPQIDMTWIKDIQTKIQLSMPSYDKEKIRSLWEQRSDNLIKWARYGWTLIEDAPVHYMDIIPESIAEADEIAMQYFTDGEMENLFEDILKYKTNIEDVKEAINCYRNTCNKGCAMILVSVIERHLTEFNIRYPLEEMLVKMEKGKRKKLIGLRAVKSIKKNIDSRELQNEIIGKLQWSTIFEFMSILFEDGNDFIIEKDSLNRNFLMHGWRERPVERVDCIKLFLAFKNFLNNLEADNFQV